MADIPGCGRQIFFAYVKGLAGSRHPGGACPSRRGSPWPADLERPSGAGSDGKRQKELVRAYVLAGFEKIHLDTSMRLGDDNREEPLSDEVIARRGASLCAIAEEAYAEIALKGAKAPCYIIGSEVPIPGGAQEAEEGVGVTRPEDCRRTISVFREVFLKYGLEDAWSRVIGLVVQPGVEFGDAEVFDYCREKAAG